MNENSQDNLQWTAATLCQKSDTTVYSVTRWIYTLTIQASRLPNVLLVRS